MTNQELFNFIGRVIAEVPYGENEIEFECELAFSENRQLYYLTIDCISFHCKSGFYRSTFAINIGDGDESRYIRVLFEKHEKWRSKRQKDSLIFHLKNRGINFFTMEN